MSLSESYKVDTVSPIENNFNNPNMTYYYCDGIARWLANNTGVKADG